MEYLSTHCHKQPVSRRFLLRSSAFGLLAVAMPGLTYAAKGNFLELERPTNPDVDERYPQIPEEIVAEVVGVSHFNLDRLKELVEPRPELARATWDWAFGDWESAIGAASHVGRKDIVEYLIGKGARPTIFTYAMLGAYQAVRQMIEAWPGVQRNPGPHGISLLQHAQIGKMTGSAGPETQIEVLIGYLQSLGDADSPEYATLEAEEKEKYLGDYKYGEGEKDGFSVRLNMRKLLSLGKIGKFGGALYPIGDHTFTYNGVPSVKVVFEVSDGEVRALSVHEPGLVVKAVRV